MSRVYDKTDYVVFETLYVGGSRWDVRNGLGGEDREDKIGWEMEAGRGKFSRTKGEKNKR